MRAKFNRFDQKGCFKCCSCKKQTRNTGDNGAVELCPACYIEAQEYNDLMDSGEIRE